jgi:hypothetical protein
LGAKVRINGALCGESPCVYHTRYGFPDRIHVQLDKEGFAPADFYLDTEPPLISYLLLGFGSYLFHTFAQEYRFHLKSTAGTRALAPAPPSNPATPSASPPPGPDAPVPPANPSGPRDTVPAPSPAPPPAPPPSESEPNWT